MRTRRTLLLAPLILALAACSAESAGKKPRLAYVTNCVATFWSIAEAGVKQACKDFDVECDVRMPTGQGEQKAILEDMLTRGVDGIALSPLDPANQGALIDEIARKTRLITHDSDAPGTERLCYVGMDNYDAGRMCGKLVKEALPAGGSVMLFVASVDQHNAHRRRQGVIDELLDRAPDPQRFDKPGTELRSGRFVILDTRTDAVDTARAKQNAEDALARYPDLGCMVGLFEYNTPACLEAARAADKLGSVKLVGFDENDATLQGILDGHIAGTVVQDPYRYGYESVRILAALARGDQSVLPASKFVDIPGRTIRKADARQFWDELKRLVGR